MKIRSDLAVFSVVILLTSVLSTLAIGQEAQASKAGQAGKSVERSTEVGTTLKNLQTAYYAESNENYLYSEFARKADEEGYHQVASMFRAVARAEGIHSAKKADLIKQMGGNLKTDSVGEKSLVGMTKDNLEFALLSEAYERDVMYPNFIAQARLEKQPDVVRSFSLCMAAEPRHHAMFEQTLKDLDGYQGQNVDFYVCPVCGNAVRNMSRPTCEVCQTPKDKFETVR